MLNECDPRTTNPLVVLQPTESGAVLMDVATGDCFELNRTGAEIWKRLTEGETQESIIAALSSVYAVSPDALEADMRVLLADLARHGLLKVPERRP